MGAGKTTLVAQWALSARQAGQTVLWLDGSVDTPSGVAAALARVAGFVGAEHLAPIEALSALTPLLRTTTERHVVVIDDFDRLAAELGASLMAVLRRCRGLHLVLCVRGRHDFVWDAVVGASFQLIDMDDLALTVPELVAYARNRGVDADEATAGAIMHATEGIAGLMSVGIRSAHRDGVETWWSWVNLREYVRGHVRRALPGDTAALAALGHLAGADLEPVRAAFGPQYGGVLDAIEHLGLVDRRPDSSRHYLRIPPIVADVLRALHDPARADELAALHDDVIAELERTGRILGAVELAGRTRRVESLVELVNRHWWDIAAQDVGALASAVESIPQELLAERAVLVRHLTEILPRGDGDVARNDFDDVPADDDGLRAVAAGPDAEIYLGAVMIGLMAARFRGDQAVARESARRGSIIVTGMIGESQHDVPVVIRRFHLQVGLVHLLDADLEAAERAFRRAYGPDEHETQDVPRRAAANRLALVHALRGDHPATRAWIERADAIDPPTGWLTPMIEAPRRLAELLLALDSLDCTAARRHLADLSTTTATDELWSLEIAGRAATSLLWDGVHAALHEVQLATIDRSHLLGVGTLAHTQLLATEMNLLVALGRGTEAEELVPNPHQAHPRIRVARARLLVLSGRHREALALLASLTQTTHELVRVRVEALLLTARAYEELHEPLVSSTYLAQAVRHPEFLSCFASVPRVLLTAHADEVPGLGAIVVDLELREAGPYYPERLDVITLTEREQQLVELLTTAGSRDSIARALSVSTNTVKTQLQALYRKLGVASREEAVARAYELGLLRPHPDQR